MNTETKAPLIFSAMAEVMREIEAVGKNKVNQHQKYNFRGIDDVYNMVHAALSKHGIVTPPRVISCEYEARKTNAGGDATLAKLRVEYDFTAIDGSMMRVGPVCSEALDTSDKATNKAMAFAHKYALLQTFCIPTEDVAEGDKVTIEAPPKIGLDSVPSAPSRPASTKSVSGPIASPKIPFGKNKGKALSEVTDKDVSWLLDAAQDKVNANSPQYHESNVAWLKAVQHEATKRSFGVNQEPPPPSDEDFVGGAH